MSKNSIRKHFAYISFLFLSLQGISQGGSGEFNPSAHGAFVGFPAGSQLSNLVNPYWLTETSRAGASIDPYPDIKGTPFFKADWTKGYVLFSDNAIVKNVLLSFNVFSNEIYFLGNGQVKVLNTPIPVIQFGLQSEEDSNYFTVFRCGFPGIDNYTSQTFYKVLVVGKLFLLKHLSKNIIESKNSLSEPEKFFNDSETWYLFNAEEKKMIAVKKNKDSFLQALPEYNQQMLTIIGNKKLKLKSEADFITLTNELNNNIK